MNMAEITPWDEIPIETVAEGMRRQIVTGEKLTVARMFFDDGFLVPLHAHENEQITHVLEGTMRFWFGPNREVQRDVHPGEVVVIPSNLPHEAIMIGNVIEMDTWAPRREDWLNKTDDYLRSGTTEQSGGPIQLDRATSQS